MKKIIIIIGILILGIILAGMFKFNILASLDGYNVDGNKIENNTFEKTGLLFSAIEAEEFKKKIESGEYILVDIRTPEEFQNENIPGTVLNIDFNGAAFETQIKQLDRTKKYLYYCRSGHRSGLARKYAAELGFPEVHELAGGINAWKENSFLTTLNKEK